MDDFELTSEELEMLNWFINNIKIEDYKKQIVDYCNGQYRKHKLNFKKYETV